MARANERGEGGASAPPRRQCAKCPWRRTTDPRQIPDGYSEERHRGLASTIAEPGALRAGALRMMACHESPVGSEQPCVGWLIHQLGEGNNIGLRLAVMTGRIDGNVEVDGDQHECFEDTLPRSCGSPESPGSPGSPGSPRSRRTSRRG